MAIFDNSTTLGYVRIVGAIVTYNDMIYSIPEYITNKKYIYWDFNYNPYKFKVSDVTLPTSQTCKLVVQNNFGMHTVVPSTSDNFIITFDGDSMRNVEKKIFGLYENDKITGDKFVAVETDINGIKQVVGNTESISGTLIENITKVQQKANEIDLSVNKVSKELVNNATRELINKAFIDLHSSLGIFDSKTNEYSRDDKISYIEKDEISVHLKVMDTKKNELYIETQKAKDMCIENGDTSGELAISNGEKALNLTHDNLKTTINNVISDGTITPSDRVLISNAFAQYSLRINELKNTVDDIIILGMGGSISEELSRISMKSNEISLKVESFGEGNGGNNLIRNSTAIKNLDGWKPFIDANTKIARYEFKSNVVNPPDPPINIYNAKLHLLSIDDGLCLLIQDLDSGKNILVDTGEEYSNYHFKTIDYIKSLGVTRLDYIILTHFHSDHAGEFPRFMTSFDVGDVYGKVPSWEKMPPKEQAWNTREIYDNNIKSLSSKGKSLIKPTDRQKIKLTEYSNIEILNVNNENYWDYNNISFALIYTCKDRRVYIGGDTKTVDAEELFKGTIGKCDYFIVAHHGYDGSTSMELLNEANPTVSLISTYRIDDAKLPTISRIKAVGSQVYSTHNNGHITISIDNNMISHNAKISV